MSGVPSARVQPDHHALIQAGAKAFVAALADAPQIVYSPNTLPVIDHMPELSTEIGQWFARLAGEMVWSAGRDDPAGTKRGLVRINDMFDFTSAQDSVRAGLLFTAPNEGYPEHSHPPQEMYIMLDGTGSWRFGGNSDYFEVPSGQTIYNNPRDTHGVGGERSATLSLWVLWGEGTFSS